MEKRPHPSQRLAPRALLAAAVLGAVLGASGEARAQACCAGASVLTPARLNWGEDALAGIQIKAGGVFGSFDGKARFVPSPRGAHELDLEQDLIVALRVLGSGQVSVLIPLVETWRRVPGLSEGGGGLGDTELAARWDFTLAGAHRILPGIAVTATLGVPSGRAPEHVPGVLAAAATGKGAWQGAFGLSLEQSFGKVLVNVLGSAALRSARDVNGIHAQAGPLFTGLVAAGWMFDRERALALALTYTGELATRADGVAVAGSSKRLLRLGVTGGHPLGDGWRVQGSVYVDPPIPGVGRNDLTHAGLTATVLRLW